MAKLFSIPYCITNLIGYLDLPQNGNSLFLPKKIVRNNEVLTFNQCSDLGFFDRINGKKYPRGHTDGDGSPDWTYRYTPEEKNTEEGKQVAIQRALRESRLVKIEDKILGDACEALIGAIYLDSGYKIAESFILRFWNDEIKKSGITEIDSKTKLQEYSLKRYKKLPSYKVLSYKGPQHNPSYKVSVKIYDSKFFYGIGNSKKIAEHDAAKKLLKDLKIK
mgnify:CR=1 FL=1